MLKTAINTLVSYCSGQAEGIAYVRSAVSFVGGCGGLLVLAGERASGRSDTRCNVRTWLCEGKRNQRTSEINGIGLLFLSRGTTRPLPDFGFMRSLLLLESEAMSPRDTIQKEMIQGATTLRKGRQRSSQFSTTFRSQTSIGIDLLLVMRCDAKRAIVTSIPERCSKESNSRASRRTAFAIVTASQFRLGDYN